MDWTVIGDLQGSCIEKLIISEQLKNAETQKELE